MLLVGQTPLARPGRGALKGQQPGARLVGQGLVHRPQASSGESADSKLTGTAPFVCDGRSKKSRSVPSAARGPGQGPHSPGLGLRKFQELDHALPCASAREARWSQHCRAKYGPHQSRTSNKTCLERSNWGPQCPVPGPDVSAAHLARVVAALRSVHPGSASVARRGAPQLLDHCTTANDVFKAVKTCEPGRRAPQTCGRGTRAALAWPLPAPSALGRWGPASRGEGSSA